MFFYFRWAYPEYMGCCYGGEGVIYIMHSRNIQFKNAHILVVKIDIKNREAFLGKGNIPGCKITIIIINSISNQVTFSIAYNLFYVFVILVGYQKPLPWN